MPSAQDALRWSPCSLLLPPGIAPPEPALRGGAARQRSSKISAQALGISLSRNSENEVESRPEEPTTKIAERLNIAPIQRSDLRNGSGSFHLPGISHRMNIEFAIAACQEYWYVPCFCLLRSNEAA
jgi:hypothetical protein